jgi:uncharacterized protein YqfA (UPF0365 family)
LDIRRSRCRATFLDAADSMLQPQLIAVFMAMGLALIVALFLFVLMLTLFRPWLQGLMSGAGVSVLELIGMRMRRINVPAVMSSLILAKQSGVELSHIDLQRADLRGVDLEKLTLAFIETHKQDLGVTFDDLVELELRGRLAEKLGGAGALRARSL